MVRGDPAVVCSMSLALATPHIIECLECCYFAAAIRNQVRSDCRFNGGKILVEENGEMMLLLSDGRGEGNRRPILYRMQPFM